MFHADARSAKKCGLWMWKGGGERWNGGTVGGGGRQRWGEGMERGKVGVGGGLVYLSAILKLTGSDDAQDHKNQGWQMN